MMYRVKNQRVSLREVVVEANSKEDAKTIAFGNEIEWFDPEITDITMERIDIWHVRGSRLLSIEIFGMRYFESLSNDLMES